MVAWPISPATSDEPWYRRPPMMMPPPMPVPIVIPITLLAPFAAPSHHSPNVAQLASLSIRTGRRARSWMASRSGKLVHPRFGVVTTMPRSRSSGPGEPTPIPITSSRFAPVCAMVSAITVSIMRAMRSTTRVRSLLGARRLRAEREDVAAVFGQRAGDDVRAAEVDADQVLGARRHEVGNRESGCQARPTSPGC